MDAFDVIRRDPRLRDLAERLTSSKAPVVADGLWGSSAPLLAGLVAERLERPLLIVSAHGDEADDFRDDIETATGRLPELLPALERLADEPDAEDEAAAERLRLCMRLVERGERGWAEPLQIVAPIQALMQPTPSADAIRDSSITIEVGLTLEPERLAEWLTRQGYNPCDQVELPGDFSRRGGIIDAFSSAHSNPARIEFLGDEVESIRLFDAGTQRSSQSVDAVRIPTRNLGAATRAKERGKQTTSFLALLPADTIVAFHEPVEVQELGRTLQQRLGERVGLIPADAVFRRANDFAQLHLQRFAGGGENGVTLDVTSLPQFEPRSVEALDALAELAGEHRVVVLCDNPPEQQRFREVLREAQRTPPPGAADGSVHGSDERRIKPDPQAKRAHENEARPPEDERGRSRSASEQDASGDRLPGRDAAPNRASLARVESCVGVLHRGFRWGDTAFVPHHELFQRYRQRRTLRKVQPARPIDSFFDLSAGDYVVHALHGIGRFRGLKTIERAGRRDEYLAIEFADDAVVHVAVSQIHLVQKYIGSFRGKPTLSKVGGNAWKRTKQRVAESVTDLAAELLAIQAQRATEPGHAYPADTEWQREFEGSFLYAETEDQLRALYEIKVDLTGPRPMDRLLCGDVGYGKTELAIRAAFKVVEYGRQVAVLVPTTVLAEQHYQTFRERLADYPFAVESLSRFRTKAEQSKIVERARKGQVDILIGTHRLLSNDVRFADLGLVVIDEEQRFGVDAKEKLKRLRSTVDVLTLSATPIPRTLHMAVLGIRDISSLATAPLDRRAIVTQVRTWDDRLVREAIVRELNRDGQVYFVHNFVRDIHEVANHVRAIVPEARVVVGHGQMSGKELEQVMLRFMHRDADVLVSTNIIESGIDIPSANTIFIDRADRFGLADLHQLRGRVGRSKHRAYCYLLLSPKHPVQETAARRLKAIEQYSALGAGFQIAMRDLEIRGAGNILGAEQSGHIEAVGYEMYCQLLEQAVRKMKDEPEEPWRPVNLELGLAASIPRRYIPAERQRMEVYKRLASCRTTEDVDALEQDLRDAFGPLPDDVEKLLGLAAIRALAQPWGIRSIVFEAPDVVFAIEEYERVERLFASGPGSPRMPDAKTVHWRLPKRLHDPGALLDVLRQHLQAVGAPPRRPTAAPAVS